MTKPRDRGGKPPTKPPTKPDKIWEDLGKGSHVPRPVQPTAPPPRPPRKPSK